MFKLIGLLIGFFSAEGFLWTIFAMLLGLFLGSIADRIIAFGIGAINPLKNAYRQIVFLDTLFTLMGKMAKVDGHISQSEIDHVEAFMARMKMSETHRQQAINKFKRGADPDFDIAQCCQRFNAACGQTHDLKRALLTTLIVFAHADGRLDPAEKTLLIDISQRLGYNEQEFQNIFDMAVNQSHFAGEQIITEDALEDAYKALGVNEQSTDAEIKKAYRKLMSRNHPDKLMGQGMPKEMIDMATEQSKEIQKAYDLIKKFRQRQQERND